MESFMQLWLAAIILSLSFNAQAGIKSFDVQNLHLDFLQSKGQASADVFQMVFDFGELNLNGYNIDITKGEGNLLFEKTDTNFRLDGIDQSVLDAVSALSAERIDIKGTANKSLDLNFVNGAISLGEDVHGLKALKVNCFTNTRGDDQLISFLIPCFDNGVIYIPEIKLAQKAAEKLAPLWLASVSKEDLELNKASIFMPKKISEIKMSIIEQEFELSLQARFIFKLTLKIKGTAILNQKKNIAEIDLREAKVGFINVKKIIVNLLSKLDVTNVTVEGSVITIKL